MISDSLFEKIRNQVGEEKAASVMEAVISHIDQYCCTTLVEGSVVDFYAEGYEEGYNRAITQVVDDLREECNEQNTQESDPS